MDTPIIISYSLAAESAQFQAILEDLQSRGKFIIKSHELGADREQWFLDWQQHLLVICVEHLSESAWIESVGAVSQEKLQNFYKLLICY